MAAIVSKMWSKETVGEDANGNKIYTDGYHIVDAATRAEAETAPGLPARNTPMDGNPRYKRGPINFSRYNGPTQWLAILTYAIPPNGSWNGGGEDEDPLLKPWVWTVQESSVERANETDIKRRPKKNSAGDYFPPTPKKYKRMILVGRRYERFWDIAKGNRFIDTTNLNVINLGPIVIQSGEAICRSIKPSGDFEGDADYLLMEYQIEVGTDERARDPARPNDPPTTSGFPFDTHQLDIGNRGWYIEPTTGKKVRGLLCYATGVTSSSSGNRVLALAEDVQLLGDGMPVIKPSGELQIYVCDFEQKHIYAPQKNPNEAEWLVASGNANQWPAGQEPTASPYSTATNPMWLFQEYARVDWTDLFRLSSPPTPL